jgi:acetoin:2,6-dichlorophenolindophenol oxidoreductase subunit alpha
MTSSNATSRSRVRKATLARDERLELHRLMVLIRRVEERLAQLFSDGEVPGFIHLSIGQEAIAAGIAAALDDVDTIASTHRGHGHALAKGLPLEGFFQEIMGRDSGVCRGRGGSMHVADMSVGMLGANGIVGAGIPLALGSALAHKTLKRNAVAVAFFGDGAMAEGVLHESLNLASLWELPLLFVCENNGWSEFSPTARQFTANVRKLASAFGVEGEEVDGNDVAAVAGAARKQVAAIRKGKGPRVLECITRRVRGHFEGDPQKYRDDAGIDSDTDPVERSRRALLKGGVAEAALDRIAAEVDAVIDAAVEAARASPDPRFEDASQDVYSNVGGAS